MVSLSVGGAPDAGQYAWYDMQSGGDSFNNTNSFKPELTESTYYWVSIITDKGCEGQRSQITGTILDIPPSPSALPAHRCGEGKVILGALSDIEGTLNWYETQFSNTSLFSSDSYETPVLKESASYWVDKADANNCISERTQVQQLFIPFLLIQLLGILHAAGPDRLRSRLREAEKMPSIPGLKIQMVVIHYLLVIFMSRQSIFQEPIL